MKLMNLPNKYWNEKYEFLFNKELIEKKGQFSEHSEEGIVQCVFSVLKPQNKWCVDCGAFDGKTSSNTLALVKKGWQTVQIEGNEKFFKQLEETYKGIKNAQLVNKIVDRGYFTTDSNLEAILRTCGVPKNFDFLSIDVDGYDYEIWRSLSEFHPNLICVETNQVEHDFSVVDYDPSRSLWKYTGKSPSYHDATVGLLNKLAEEKGYDYLCWDISNAFYVRKEFGKQNEE